MRKMRAALLASAVVLALGSGTPAGAVIIIYSLKQLGFEVTAGGVILYLVLLVCGVLILYSIMFLLATTSFWFIRNDNIFDLWWYVNSFSRYPADMYKDFLGGSFRALMTYVFPVLIVANVPAASVVGEAVAVGVGDLDHRVDQGRPVGAVGGAEGDGVQGVDQTGGDRVGDQAGDGGGDAVAAGRGRGCRRGGHGWLPVSFSTLP